MTVLTLEGRLPLDEQLARQIRNQARVHLWYEEKFGVGCPPHQSTEAAIDTPVSRSRQPRSQGASSPILA